MAFTVGELIRNLQQYPKDKPVVLSRDGEGNGFSPASSTCEARYVPSSSCRGDILSEDDDAEYNNVKDVVVLWPNG